MLRGNRMNMISGLQVVKTSNQTVTFYSCFFPATWSKMAIWGITLCIHQSWLSLEWECQVFYTFASISGSEDARPVAGVSMGLTRINRPKLEMVTGRRQAVQLDLSGWSHHGDGSKVSRSVSEVQQYIRGKTGTNIHITTEQKENNKIF